MTLPDAATPETFDELLTHLGTGRWNIVYIIILNLGTLLQPSHSLSGVYLAPWLAHTCRPHPDHINITLSRDACHYVIERPTTGGEFGETEEVEVPCSQWDYDSSTFTSSLTSDYDWVCQHDHLRALYQSLYVIGTIVSPLLIGYVADRFGRVKVLVATQVLFSAASIAVCFAHNLPLIFVLRVLIGCTELVLDIVLALEVCEPKHRAAVAILSGLTWSAGTVLWGGLAYLLRAWRPLQLAASLPTLLMFPILFFLDESPRWLVVSGQPERAKRVLKKAARWNKATLPCDDQLDDLFSRIYKEEAQQQSKRDSDSDATGCKTHWKPKLLSNKNIAVITLITALCYFCDSLVFDGLNLAGDLYSDNLYLYLVLAGLAEMPGIILIAPVVHRLGRKGPLVACFLGCGVVNISIPFLLAEQRIASFAVAMVGKMLVCASLQIIYLYSSELFPTEVRTSGVEGTNCVGQVGSFLSPYISSLLGSRVHWLPSAVYGIISIVTALAALFLPETKDRPLPETVADLRDPSTVEIQEKKDEGQQPGEPHGTLRGKTAETEWGSLGQ